MSFGGAVSAMLTSLKNNKRSRTSTFEKIERYGSNSKKSDKLFFRNKATSEEISRIGEEIRRENKRVFLLRILLITVFCMVVLFAIGFVKF